MAKGTDTKVGGAYVEVSADASKFDASMNRVRTETVKTAATVDAGANKMRSSLGRAFADISKGVGAQIQAFTQLLGRITAVVGVATTFYNIGTKIAGVLKSGSDRASEFLLTLNDPSAANNLKQIEARLDEINSRISASRESLVGAALNSATRGLENEKKILERQASSLRRQLNAARGAEEKEAAKKNAADIEDERLRLVLERLRIEGKEEQALNLEYQIEADRLRKRLNDARFEEERQQLQLLQDERIKLLEAEFAARKRKAEEEAAAAARAVAEQLRDAFASAFQESISASSSSLRELTANVSNIGQIVGRLATVMRNRG